MADVVFFAYDKYLTAALKYINYGELFMYFRWIINITLCLVSFAFSEAAYAQDYGIRYVSDTSGILFFQNNGYTANFNYLCLDGDCRLGSLVDDVFQREVSVNIGQTYDVEFRIQHDPVGQIFVTDTVTYTANGTLDAGVQLDVGTVPDTGIEDAAVIDSGSSPTGSYGLRYLTDSTGVLFLVNDGYTASFNFLCLNGDCRSGTLEAGEFRRVVNVTLGQSYFTEYKVQHDPVGQVTFSDTVVFERPSSVVQDAGEPDLGEPDAGQDASEPDLGEPDVGQDAGEPDLGEPDVGQDAGEPDLGEPDVGQDAGELPVFRSEQIWENAMLPGCPSLFEGNPPELGYFTYLEGSQVVFRTGGRFSDSWGGGLRAVFFRQTEGRLVHLGTRETQGSGREARIDIPQGWLDGQVVWYVSYQRNVAPYTEALGNALAYQDSALFALNRSESCVADHGVPDDPYFVGWTRVTHPQGAFFEHNVFSEFLSAGSGNVQHFMNMSRFEVEVVEDSPGQPLVFDIRFQFADSSERPDGPQSTNVTSVLAAFQEGQFERAGSPPGSPRQAHSEECERLGQNYFRCRSGQFNFGYGQNIDWELRVIHDGTGGFNLYSQMFFYVPGFGWTTESVDPRANGGGVDTTDAFGADDFERAAAFSQHARKNLDLDDVMLFVSEHVDLRETIGTDLNPGFRTCVDCHINDGRSNDVFDVAGVGQLIAPPLIGLGLLEQVDVPNRVGFGWRGNHISIEAAVRNALNIDFGVSSPATEMVERLVHYTQFIAVPQRDKSKLFDEDVLAGERLFKNEFQCETCHIEVQVTRDGQSIRPYSDLLAHDMGDGTFRTAPLWAIGRAAEVAAFSLDTPINGTKPAAIHGHIQRQQLGAPSPDESRTLFMHDGRARGLDEAVRAHGGEAEASRNAYINASETQRNQLLEFLRSL